MYKCSECGTEYSVKPDYCDCGNDTFIEIKENIEIIDIEEPKPKKKVKKTFDEQYPWFEDFKQSLDPLSVIIFGICIVLSVCLLVFVKPDNTTTTTEQTKPKIEKPDIKIANIDSFWDDTPPKAVKKEQTIITQQPQPKVVVSQQPESTQTTVNKPIKNFIQNNIVKKTPTQTSKTASTKKQTQNKTTTATTKQQTTKQPTQVQQPKQNTTTQKQTTQATTQQITKQPTQIQQPKQNTTITQPSPKLNIQTNTQELKNYKNGLRNTITSKIDFENIYGDGKCTVAFKIDSNGKLTNKSFSKQSSNGTLNDEVYSAIMSTPKYKTPPSEYSGQVLYFSVEFKNGTYKTTLN